MPHVNQLVERKGLFGAMDLEVSVWDWLALLLQACNEVEYCGREHMLTQIIHLIVGAEDGEEETRVFQFPLRGHPWCLKVSHRAWPEVATASQ